MGPIRPGWPSPATGTRRIWPPGFRRRAAETLAIVRREGGLNAYQVASRMTWDIRADSWADFPLNQKWFATGEALAHLEYLVEEGAIVRALDQEGMARYTAQ